jgi:DNA invertase Pin-like site-specific DNA recombinase
VDAAAGIPCVIYGAKSTEDRRGSIPEQLRECREAIDADPLRRFVADYEDERFSAYRRDRGPGLADATQHAEDLAAEHGLSELWAQHSDRLARGDGRAARHTVEIALWALKSDVRVRTLQDPDTFRDLLYAVVTGQRNNEDSKRKGIASQAGTRRAAQRGEYIGHLPDGYRLRTWVDERQQLRREMIIDIPRQPLIELIFRLALRGRSCGQIATSVNRAGWLTKPVRRRASPRAFDVSRVYAIVKNPRYAGLSVYAGEVAARDCWAPYISERQHERVLALLRKRRLGIAGARRMRETYLLARLACCGRCGSPLHVYSGRCRRNDGSRARAYLCSSHRGQRGNHRCDAPPIEAHAAEAMVVASVSALLARDPPQTRRPGDSPSAAAAHEELRAAALTGDERRLGRAMELEFARMQPHAALIREVAISQRQARELAEAQRLRAWIEQERLGRTEASRAQCPELNELLRSWFSAISIDMRDRTVVLTGTRRGGSGTSQPPAKLVIDRASWARSSARANSQAPRYVVWEKAEVIGALQGWADVNGRSPTQADWRYSGAGHPCALTVRRRLGAWERAVRKAGLAPPPRGPRHDRWERLELIEALGAWARRHGRPPTSAEWVHARSEHPCASSVRQEFGRWNDALRAAGLAIAPRQPQRAKQWPREEIVQALRAWTASHGRAPFGPDWVGAGPGRPCTGTVYKCFGSWGGALEAAELSTSDS